MTNFLAFFRHKMQNKITIRRELTKSCKEHKGNGISFFAVKADGERYIRVGQICHGSWGISRMTEHYENISYYYDKTPKEYKEYFKEYVDYVINESPWARAFTTKRVGVGLAHNLKMNLDNHPSIVMGGVIAIRSTYEFNKLLPAYAFLRKQGFSRRTSFLVSTLFDEQVEQLMPYRALHALWDVTACLEAVIKFMKKGFSDKLTDTVLKGNTYFRIYLDSYGRTAASPYQNSKVIKSMTITKEKRGAFGHIMDVVKYPPIEVIAKEIDEYAQW